MSTWRSPRTLGLSVVIASGLVASACGGGAESTDSAESATASTEAVADTEVTEGESSTEEAASAESGGSELFAGDFVDLNGDPVVLTELEGQDVVLWFWAPW